MKLLTSLLFLSALLQLNAQDSIRIRAAAEFKAVNQAYINAEKLRMDVNYELFPSYTSTASYEKARGVYMKNGNSTYSSLLGIVSLTNNNVSLTLDSNEQAIVIADPPTKQHRNPSLVNIDTLLRLCSSIERRQPNDGVAFYKMRFDGVVFSEYNAIEVYIDEKSDFISRLTLYYRVEMDLDEEGSKCTKDRPRLEIVYSNIQTNPSFAADQFSESGIIRGSGKKYSAAPAYSKYRVINNKLD